MIGPSTVLSAAHCFIEPNNPGKIKVMVSNHDTSSPGSTNEKLHLVKEIVNHPKYDAETMDYDFAILKLASPVTFSTVANAACLALNDGEDYVGIDMVVSGWGMLREDGEQASILQVFSSSYFVDECHTHIGGGYCHNLPY